MSTAPLSGTGGRTPDEIDAARAAHQDLASDWLAPASYSIPGMSERPDGCGQWFPFEVCDECGEPVFSESHCGLRKCPECWMKWVRDTAESIVARVQAYRWAQDDGLDRRVVHAMFSPDSAEKWTISRVDSMRRESYERAADAGVSGGAALTHLWRTTDEFDREYATDQPYASKWKYLRDTYGRAWRSKTEVSPHIHQIAAASEFEPEQDGWVAERIRTLSPMRSLSDGDSYRDLANLAIYLLTHTAVADGEQAIRWFGDLYPGGFDAEEELSSGALATIERKAAEAVEPDGEDGESDEMLDLGDECEGGTEGCPGEPMPIWDVPGARRRNHWTDLDRETRNRMTAAVEWMMGDLDPPPCRSEQAAREMLDTLV